MSAATQAARAYQQTFVVSRSPRELVALLYDGAVQRLTVASDAVSRGDRVAKGKAIADALAIVGELQNTLNVKEGGPIAVSLDALYTFVNGRLVEANIANDAAPLKESLRVLSPLRDAWAQIALAERQHGGA